MSRDEPSALISPATRRNWARLATQPAGKLTSRANKRQSRRRIFPVEYLVHRKNIPAIQALVRFIEEQGLETGQALLALGKHMLDRKGLLHKRHVACVLDEYDGLFGSAGHELHRAFCHLNVPGDEYDVLGAVYQCLLSEGEKNSRGSYYTPLPVRTGRARSLLWQRRHLAVLRSTPGAASWRGQRRHSRDARQNQSVIEACHRGICAQGLVP